MSSFFYILVTATNGPSYWTGPVPTIDAVKHMASGGKVMLIGPYGCDDRLLCAK